MKEIDYICFTDNGHWHFYAENDVEAFRKSLWFCWRDGENFDHIESQDYPKRILRLATISANGRIETL